MEQRYQSSGTYYVKYITDESSAIDFVKATSWNNQYVYYLQQLKVLTDPNVHKLDKIAKIVAATLSNAILVLTSEWDVS